jgi:two-component system NtrC family response regulator
MTDEMRRTLLIVEDDPGLQRQLKWAFDGYDVRLAGSRDEAIAACRRFEPEVVLQDLGLPPDADGVEEGFATLRAILQLAPLTKVIVVTGRDGREHALRAVASGSFDFCQKPVDLEVLRVVVDRAARMHRIEAENSALRNVSVGGVLPGVIAASDAMLKVCRMVEKLAPVQATVLLLGESGTGKERLANALHLLSPRRSRPFVAINCAAIPENLLESELFGYERGAFTGAVKQTPGKVERADGGTLFLDEIGDMPLPLQAKMLRFLQERVVERIGGRQAMPVDVRIIAATNKDLASAVKMGSFREDLYYRIAEVSIPIPPLREREDDSLLIAHALLRAAAGRHGRITGLRFSPDAARAIRDCPWPGNVRELENAVNRAVIMVEGSVIGPEELGLQMPSETPASELGFLNLREVRLRAEAQALRRALAISAGNLSRAAELLGIARPTLYDLMSRAGLSPGGDEGNGGKDA